MVTYFLFFFFHVDVVEQIRSWVIIILHQFQLLVGLLFFFYFIQKCIRSISFEPYYLIMPNCLLTSLSFSLTLLLKGIKIIVISVGNLFSSFFFHVDVVEQISWWVIVILHKLFLNQTVNSYPITSWSSVFYFIQRCIKSISFEPYYLIMPNCLLTSLSFSLTLLLKGKKLSWFLLVTYFLLFSFMWMLWNKSVREL